MKILLIILILDTLINYFSKNYIENNIQENIRYQLGIHTKAAYIYACTKLLQIGLIVWILIKFIISL